MPENEDAIKDMLTREEYEVLREKGTEAPFTSEYVHEKADGTYACKVCGNPLFDSTAKFDSGTGWPSFDKPIEGAVEYHKESNGMPALRSLGVGGNRTEITCARCGSHLGHVFDDGPTETGQRYCINGVCLDLEEK